MWGSMNKKLWKIIGELCTNHEWTMLSFAAAVWTCIYELGVAWADGVGWLRWWDVRFFCAYYISIIPAYTYIHIMLYTLCYMFRYNLKRTMLWRGGTAVLVACTLTKFLRRIYMYIYTFICACHTCSHTYTIWLEWHSSRARHICVCESWVGTSRRAIREMLGRGQVQWLWMRTIYTYMDIIHCVHHAIVLYIYAQTQRAHACSLSVFCVAGCYSHHVYRACVFAVP